MKKTDKTGQKRKSIEKTLRGKIKKYGTQKKRKQQQRKEKEEKNEGVNEK